MARNAYINEDFLLETKWARELYHRFAEGMPIIDFHSHLPPREIAEDRRWQNLAQVWLHGDHYKWRAMRTNGVEERYCAGDASDHEKFDKWAATMPALLRNPLYDWSHLELKRYFDVSDRLLGPDTAAYVWSRCNAKLAESSFSCRSLLKQSNVAVVCTTDDPADPLEHHRAIACDPSLKTRVLPSWRPDRAMAVEKPAAFNDWTDRIAAAAGSEIGDYDSFVNALRNRHDFFHRNGCRISDHGIETVSSVEYTGAEIRAIFRKLRDGIAPDRDETLKFKSAMLYEFAVMNHEKGWVQQYHLGALRNVNGRMFALLGPDTGFDAVSDAELIRPLTRFLDRLDREGKLAKTILYNLNPRDNLPLVALMGCFQDGSVPGKMQFGSAWWFLDCKSGMERQMDDLSKCGLLSRFVGMLTDSRSFLSFPRHEYFRRVLCNSLGDAMAKGAMPRDMKLAGGMVRDICCNNAARYFGFMP